jgi:hypothetical protein
MKLKLRTGRSWIIGAVTLALTVGFIIHAYATTPSISIPEYDYCGVSSFTATVSATSLSSITGWQLNVTWAAGNINLTSYAYGTPWTGGTSASNIQYSKGTALMGYAFNDGTTYSNSGTAALVTMTFRVLRNPTTSSLHIATSSDAGSFPTTLLDPSLSSLSYTTSDGFFTNCVLRPGG